MSGDTVKADQIAYRFYTKLVLVVASARTTIEQRGSKVDKWVRRLPPSLPSLLGLYAVLRRYLST
jgi:autophagy-related protein 13